MFITLQKNIIESFFIVTISSNLYSFVGFPFNPLPSITIHLEDVFIRSFPVNSRRKSILLIKLNPFLMSCYHYTLNISMIIMVVIRFQIKIPILLYPFIFIPHPFQKFHEIYRYPCHKHPTNDCVKNPLLPNLYFNENIFRGVTKYVLYVYTHSEYPHFAFRLITLNT